MSNQQTENSADSGQSGSNAGLGDNVAAPEKLAVIEFIHVRTDSDFSPQLDVEFRLELPDGGSKEFGFTFRIARQLDAHGGTPRVSCFIGWHDKIRLGYESEPIDSVLFEIRNMDNFRSFLGGLSSDLAAFVDHSFLSPNVQIERLASSELNEETKT